MNGSAARSWTDPEERIAALEAELASSNEQLEQYRRTLRDATEVCLEAARGNLEPRILHIPRDGDVGLMLHAINHLLDLTDAFVREARASLEYASREKYYRQVVQRGLLGTFSHGAALINQATAQMAKKTEQLAKAQQARLALADDFEAAIAQVMASVAAAATEARATAESLTQTADHTSRQSTTVATASGEACRSMETVASAAEELHATVGEIERRVKESSQIAQNAVAEADKSTETVLGLSDASKKISHVVSLITQVASQTRLLALNAAIEAARVGEAGKGFAVVASEVKNLAAQTATATEEIEAQVKAMQEATTSAVWAIEGIGGTIRQMSEISTTVASSVAEQRIATQEISRSIQDAALGTKEISTSVATVSTAAQDTSFAASNMLQAAGDLSQLAETLRVEVDRFLHEVRSGT